MIKKNNQTIGAIYKGSTPIEKIYKGSVLVWEAWKKLVKQGVPPLTLSKCKENKLLNYQIYGNSKQGRLPKGYTELEYIENTNTQYIDTNFIPNQDTRVVMDFQLTSTATSGYALFGTRVSTNSKGFTFQKISNGYWGGMYGDTLVNGNTKQFDTNRHIVNKNKNMVYLDGTTLMSFDSQTFTCTGNMYLFAMNNNGEATVATQPIRVFSFKVYDNGTLIRDFIPCIDNNNNIGMYDLANKVFYTNAGTGTFTAGPEIDLPDGYIKLDYIEATGEQYIDTGVSPDANTQVDYKVRFRQDATPASPIMGVRLGSSNNNRFFPIAYNAANTDYRTAFGLTTGTTGTIDFNTDYEGSFQPQNEVSIINGTSYSLANHRFTKTDNYNMYLFATLGYTDNLYQSKGVIYYVKIYQNGVLVRNFIPCKTNEGEVGMYDTVNHTFYSNQGTGNFVGGTIEIESVGDNETGLPLGYTQLDYIQATSGQYIDTRYVGNLDTRAVIDFDFTLSGSRTAFTIFGSRTGANTNDNIGVLWGVYQSNYGFNIDFGNYANYRAFYETSSENTRFKADLGKDGRYVYDSNGNVLASNTNVNSTAFNSPSNLLLFKQYGGPTTARDYTGKVYSCKIYDGGNLVRDFIPCINDQNVVGMYDTVEKTFYGSETSTPLVAGEEIAKGGYKIPVSVTDTNNITTTTNIYLDEPLRKIGDADAVKLPSGYTQLEYIESTGTQYIDTGITATDNTGMSIKYRYTAEGSAAISGIFKSGAPRKDVFFISSQTGSLPGQAFVAHNGFTSSTTLENVVLNTDYIMKINYNNDGKIYYNDNYVGDVGTLGLYNATIPIFARLNASNKNITASNSRIYYVEFTEGSTISHKFIPCINDQNVVGLYDIVNDTFYSNEGTGTFTAGPIIYVDYLDYENQKLYRNVTPTFDSKTTTEETVTLPDVLLNKGTNIVDVETSITPSNLLVKYKGKEV